MREAKRIYKIQPRGAFMRGADGQLKPASDDREIADIWAEQKRIRLRESIEADKRKAEKTAKRKQWRQQLFQKGGAPGEVVTLRPTTGHKPKAVEIKISMPALPKLPKLPRDNLFMRLRAVPGKVWLWIGLAVAIFFVLPTAVHISTSHPAPNHTANTTTIKGKATHAATGPVKGTPSYATVLPAGKSITSLGGWSRISPPGRDPVYAYADSIGGVRIDVSEQPLPANFKSDTATQVANLAQNFNASEKLTVGGTTVYLGTSIQGPQSVILAKQSLLILIKSASTLTVDQWTGYINSLQ
ncbi:MAG TPA: hypothetical protein VLF91_06165 [Candidatus Saccharimonadales bacterium]|nr:hypothetical protein [Candidatus Saccharimonadales bacterium]